MATLSRNTYFPGADVFVKTRAAVMQQASTAEDTTTSKASAFDVKKAVIVIILAWISLKVIGQVFDGNGNDNADIAINPYNVAAIALTVMVFIPLIKFFFARYYVAGFSEYSALI